MSINRRNAAPTSVKVALENSMASATALTQLQGVRDQIHAFATAQHRCGEARNYYVEMNVLVMDDWWQAIDAAIGPILARKAMLDVPTWRDEQTRLDPNRKFTERKFMQRVIHALRVALSERDGR